MCVYHNVLNNKPNTNLQKKKRCKYLPARMKTASHGVRCPPLLHLHVRAPPLLHPALKNIMKFPPPWGFGG